MGGTTLHAGILAQWFELLLLSIFLKCVMFINGILFDVVQPYEDKGQRYCDPTRCYFV